MLVGPDADRKRRGTGQRRRPRRAQAGRRRPLAPLRTGVPEAPPGQGVGSKLVRGTLEALRPRSVKVVPRCEFVAAYVGRHPEYRGLLAEEG